MSRDMMKLQLSQHLSRDKKCVARHNETPVKSTLLSRDKKHVLRDMSFMLRGSDIMLSLLYILKLQYMHFQFDYFCSVATYGIIFWCSPVYYKILILWNSLIYGILFWNHKSDVTSLVKVHRECSPAAHILHTKFDWACDVIFMVSK